MAGKQEKEIQDMDDQGLEEYLKKRFSKIKYATIQPTPVDPISEKIDFDNVYNGEHLNRGLAIIICNYKFNVKDLEDIYSAQSSAFSIQCSFHSLGFHVEIFFNLKAQQMLHVARQAAKLYQHKNADLFVCAVITHGHESDVLYGVDGHTRSVQQITNCFNNEGCPSLENKPRLFFINACRGGATDEGVTYEVEVPRDKFHGVQETDDSSSDFAQPLSPDPVFPDDNIEDIEAPSQNRALYPDCLIMYSSPPGYKTPFCFDFTNLIPQICFFLTSSSVKEVSWLHGLTSVIGIVARDYQVVFDGKIYKLMPVIDTMLINDIFIMNDKTIPSQQ